MKNSILAIDDDIDFLESLKQLLELNSYEVDIHTSPLTAINHLRNRNYKAILMDVSMPQMHGLDLLTKIVKKYPHIPVIMVSGTSNISTAMQAVKIGAFDFIEKPVDPDRLISLLSHIGKSDKILTDNSYDDEPNSFKNMITVSRAMIEIKQIIKKIAPIDTRVLITGESGTGKELIADAIHELSHRKSYPLVKINCSAIPSELLESELFGYRKGAFTGATQSKIGKFEQANGGTIFLDEIADMPFHLQPKLLRILEDQILEPLGTTQSKKIDVRVIAATNKNMRELIANDSFREDLFHRLNAINIHIPPLRERKEDILPLAEHFLEIFSQKYKKRIHSLTKQAASILLNYDWPGNVRELKHTIEKIVIFTENKSKLEISDVIKGFKFSLNPLTESPKTLNSKELPLREKLLKYEKECILNALIATNWEICTTADLLGIDRTNLYRKMKKFGIEKTKE